MPIDPEISLHAGDQNPAVAGIGANALSPLSTIGKFADVQNQLNQNRLFQQTMTARKIAGQIMATSPDIETGIKGILADQNTAPYLGEFINTLRQSELTMTQVAGENQKQATDGVNAVIGALPAALVNPGQLSSIIDARMAPLSPTARALAKPAVDAIVRGLTTGLTGDPQNDLPLFKKNVMGWITSNGVTPEVLSNIIGKNKDVDVKSGQLTGVEHSVLEGGGFTSATTIPYGLPKQITDLPGPEGQHMPTVVGGMGGGINGPSLGSAGNALTPNHAGAGGSAGPHPLAVGPTAAQAEYLGHRGTDIADYEKNLDDRVGNGATLRKNVSEVIDAAKTAETGGGAETYAKLGSLLQAIGVKTPTVDKWANGSLAGSQVIDKVALQNSMSQLKQQLTGVGGSRLNAQEFVAYLNKNPNLTTDPRAMVQIFNLWNQFYDRDKTEQQAFDKFKAGKPTGDKGLDSATGDKSDTSRWPALWNQSDYMAKFAPGGEISSAGVKGIPHPANVQALLDKYKPKAKQ